MKSVFVTLGFLLVATQAANSKSLKSLLQTDGGEEVEAPGAGAGAGPFSCNCNLSNETILVGLPSLGQAVVQGYSSAASATTGSSVTSNPDTQSTGLAAAETCSCSTAVFTKKRSQVKNNNF